MSNNSNNSSSATAGGIGFVGLLTLVFIVLKLIGTITWSWFWVLSPMVFSLIFWILVLVIIGIIACKVNK